jgi:hypothetical protein
VDNNAKFWYRLTDLSNYKGVQSACNLFHADFLRGLYFNPEDGEESSGLKTEGVKILWLVRNIVYLRVSDRWKLSLIRIVWL